MPAPYPTFCNPRKLGMWDTALCSLLQVRLWLKWGVTKSAVFFLSRLTPSIQSRSYLLTSLAKTRLYYSLPWFIRLTKSVQWWKRKMYFVLTHPSSTQVLAKFHLQNVCFGERGTNLKKENSAAWFPDSGVNSGSWDLEQKKRSYLWIDLTRSCWRQHSLLCREYYKTMHHLSLT